MFLSSPGQVNPVRILSQYWPPPPGFNRLWSWFGVGRAFHSDSACETARASFLDQRSQGSWYPSFLCVPATPLLASFSAHVPPDFSCPVTRQSTPPEMWAPRDQKPALSSVSLWHLHSPWIPVQVSLFPLLSSRTLVWTRLGNMHLPDLSCMAAFQNNQKSPSWWGFGVVVVKEEL